MRVRKSEYDALRQRHMSASDARESAMEELRRLEDAVIAWVDEVDELLKNAPEFTGPLASATDRLNAIGCALREDRKFFGREPA